MPKGRKEQKKTDKEPESKVEAVKSGKEHGGKETKDKDDTARETTIGDKGKDSDKQDEASKRISRDTKDKDDSGSSKGSKTNGTDDGKGVESEKKSELTESKTKDVLSKRNTKDFPISDKVAEKVVSQVPDEEVKKEDVSDDVLSGKKLLTVQDIIDALSIIVHSSKNISTEKYSDFITLKDMNVEMPKAIEELPSELFFQGDIRGMWCVMFSKIRFSDCPEKNVENYPSLMKHLHHVIEGTAKEFMRYFRIKRKIDQGTRNILDPTVLGLDKSLFSIAQEQVRNILIQYWQYFVYIHRPEYDEHRIFMQPILHNLHRETQEFILHDDVQLRNWMEAFAIRKLLIPNFGRNVIYGENRTRWGRHLHPRLLPVLTDEIPNINQLSVGYAASFCTPNCTISELDITQLSQTMQTNVNRADPLTEIIIAPENECNYGDFRRLLMAFMFPGQVMIDVNYERDVNVYLAGFISLCMKLLFSTTPGFQNITRDSALTADIRIGNMLGDMGYTTFPGASLNVGGKRENSVHRRMMAEDG